MEAHLQSRPTALALVVYGEHIFDNVSDIKAFLNALHITNHLPQYRLSTCSLPWPISILIRHRTW